VHPVGKTIRYIKMNDIFYDGHDEHYHHQKYVEDRTVRACCRYESVVFFLLPAGCRDAANCRYYICSQAKNQVSRPRRDDLFHQFRSNFAGPTGTWVRLIVQNFTSIGAPGWKCGHKNIKNFHLLEKCRNERLP